MNSKITIEVDFDNNREPVIQIIQRDSDDVRDKLIKDFLQCLGGESSWLKIKFVGGVSDPTAPDRFQRIHISPIPPNYFENESAIMTEQARVSKKINRTPNGPSFD